MVIKGANTIREYLEIRDNKVEQWIADNFVEGAISWRWISSTEIELKDRVGAVMVISTRDID